MQFEFSGDDGCAGMYVCLEVTYHSQKGVKKVMRDVYDINITLPHALQDLCYKEQLDLDNYEIFNEMGDEETLDDRTLLHLLTYNEDETVKVPGFHGPLDIILLEMKLL